MTEKPSLAIVGAGLTGLCLAHMLRRHGIPSFILDKGRSPGGRLATLKRDDLRIDYGPGWFHTDEADTAPEIQEALRILQAEEVDANDLSDDVRKRLPACDRIRSWHVPGGIRQIAERLADSLEVSNSHHLRRIERTPTGWRISGTVSSEQDRPFTREARGLVLTQPWPQVRELLETSGLFEVPAPVHDEVNDDYERVLVLILESDDFPVPPGPPWQGEFAGIEPVRSIRWQMSERPGHRRILTIFADPRWSRTHWEESDEEVRRQLLDALHSIFGRDFQVDLIRQHRWKYARLADSAIGNPGPSVLSADPLAIAAGEAFGVTPESPAGLLSAQVSARLAASLLSEWASGLSGQ